MRRLELVLLLGLLSVGCSSEYVGEKGALAFRLRLGGCTSVPLAETPVAVGGETDLEIGDDEKRTTLTVASGAPEVLAIATPATFELKCPDDACEQTRGRVTLQPLQEGSARLTFTSGAELVDAVTLRARRAARLVIVDEDGDSEDLGTRVGTSLELTARLLHAGSDIVVATRPFTWRVEGGALAPTDSDEGHVTLEAIAAGTSTVSVTFRELTATTVVKVKP
ncbi:MAG: hypothetical protein ACK4N5_17060 [Myxococcales bacterium]